MSDVPRSLQSWVSTIHTVVLTADVFQLFIKCVTCNLSPYTSYAYVLAAVTAARWLLDTHKKWSRLFWQQILQKLKNVSCEYDRMVVETQLCKLRDTLRHAHWARLCHVPFVILWCIGKKTNLLVGYRTPHVATNSDKLCDMSWRLTFMLFTLVWYSSMGTPTRNT